MAVIKSTPAPESQPRQRSVISAELAEASQEAKAKLDEARRAAAAIIEDAERQRDKLLEEYRNIGRQEGLAKMTAELARAKVQAGELLRQADKDILTLSLKVAEKIIGHDLLRDPSLLTDICANAIENLRYSRQLVIKLHPGDAAILREHKPRLLELISRNVDIAIKEDVEVEQGGCVLHTEFGTIDAQLSTQLAMLSDVLLNDVKRNDEEE
jgi:type III secretion protein L